MTLVALDLFCGAGGLSLGLLNAGFELVGAVDSWAPAVRAYAQNFKHPVIQADLAKVSASDLLTRLRATGRAIDLIAGGPPCQGFSIQRIGADYDDRNDLIFKYAEAVLTIGPKMFLMENVPGLLGRRGRHLAARFGELMTTGGYDWEAVIVDALDWGVPQVRRRVFWFGWKRTLVRPFSFPTEPAEPMLRRTVHDAIGDLASPPADFTPLNGDLLHRRTRLSALNLERLRHIPPGGGFESLPVALRVNAHKNGAFKIGHRGVYGRLAPDRPAGTITAKFDSFTRGRFAHPLDDRNLTLREGARLQTFPDDFLFTEPYGAGVRLVGSQEEVAALIGNAVPPHLAEAIGRAIIDHLRRPSASDSVSCDEASFQYALFHEAQTCHVAAQDLKVRRARRGGQIGAARSTRRSASSPHQASIFESS